MYSTTFLTNIHHIGLEKYEIFVIVTVNVHLKQLFVTNTDSCFVNSDTNPTIKQAFVIDKTN